jgi:hypothetical protein
MFVFEKLHQVHPHEANWAHFISPRIVMTENDRMNYQVNKIKTADNNIILLIDETPIIAHGQTQPSVVSAGGLKLIAINMQISFLSPLLTWIF